MIKKKVKKEESVKPAGVCVKVCTRKVISKLEFDFGRGDLNTLRDKLNEVIEEFNGN